MFPIKSLLINIWLISCMCTITKCELGSESNVTTTTTTTTTQQNDIDVMHSELNTVNEATQINVTGDDHIRDKRGIGFGAILKSILLKSAAGSNAFYETTATVPVNRNRAPPMQPTTYVEQQNDQLPPATKQIQSPVIVGGEIRSRPPVRFGGDIGFGFGPGALFTSSKNAFIDFNSGGLKPIEMPPTTTAVDNTANGKVDDAGNGGGNGDNANNAGGSGGGGGGGGVGGGVSPTTTTTTSSTTTTTKVTSTNVTNTVNNNHPNGDVEYVDADYENDYGAGRMPAAGRKRINNNNSRGRLQLPQPAPASQPPRPQQFIAAKQQQQQYIDPSHYSFDQYYLTTPSPSGTIDYSYLQRGHQYLPTADVEYIEYPQNTNDYNVDNYNGQVEEAADDAEDEQDQQAMTAVPLTTTTQRRSRSQTKTKTKNKIIRNKTKAPALSSMSQQTPVSSPPLLRRPSVVVASMPTSPPSPPQASSFVSRHLNDNLLYQYGQPNDIFSSGITTIQHNYPNVIGADGNIAKQGTSLSSGGPILYRIAYV